MVAILCLGVLVSASQALALPLFAGVWKGKNVERIETTMLSGCVECVRHDV